MRGCLATIALLIVIVLAATWFGLPRLLGTLAEGGLSAAGLSGTDTSVTVDSDPPVRLLGLTADTVRIRSTHATYRGIRAGTIDVTLHDVQLLDRAFGSIDGQLTNVVIPGSSAATETDVPLVALSGSSKAMRATLTLDATDVQALASAAIQSSLGTAPKSVTLSAPDKVKAMVAGQAINGHLAVRDDGALVLILPAAVSPEAIPLISPGSGTPFKVISFRIEGGALTIVASVLP